MQQSAYTLSQTGVLWTIVFLQMHTHALKYCFSPSFLLHFHMGNLKEGGFPRDVMYVHNMGFPHDMMHVHNMWVWALLAAAWTACMFCILSPPQ